MNVTLKYNFTLLIVLLSIIDTYAQRNERQTEILIKELGSRKYNKLMQLTLDEFDQSNKGFRKYSGQYELLCLIVPEYIAVNKLNEYQAVNLHWHLGQFHAYNLETDLAIAEMEQSNLPKMPVYWRCYVEGSIAFLKRDKAGLEAALNQLKTLDNQMNRDVLERLLDQFDNSYWSAYNNLSIGR